MYVFHLYQEFVFLISAERLSVVVFFYQNPEEEEWEAFKKEIAVEVAVSQDIQAEDELEETVERQIEEIDDQMRAWTRWVFFHHSIYFHALIEKKGISLLSLRGALLYKESLNILAFSLEVIMFCL